eukprot:CAMPEP_0168722348 /NCGR_PEP_ID=MMETSP0724-20121128/2553_1 /TAXON_ID=265536 /ORGANISM="Amphiprora sp., Strain CCMP467" /LENGTH=710 /DNA_ID=CAMNT_0008769021 /DNA_START=301 /DNA_END=2432 /DNA_ORIENTATION=+
MHPSSTRTPQTSAGAFKPPSSSGSVSVVPPPSGNRQQNGSSKSQHQQTPRRKNRRKQNKKPRTLAQLFFSFSFWIALVSVIFVLCLFWTQTRYAVKTTHNPHFKVQEAWLSNFSTNSIGKEASSVLEEPLSSPLYSSPDSSVTTEESSTVSRLQNGRSQAELYHEAWYIDETPDYEAAEHIYEDARIQQLVKEQRSLLSTPSYKPYQFDLTTHNKSSSLDRNMSAHHPILTTLRHVQSTRGHFNPTCFRYRFPNVTIFPTMSIVVAKERAGLLSMTVHSLVARTPPEILHQIIIVDDNGEDARDREEVDDEDEIRALVELHPDKIVYIRNKVRLGCAGSRLEAIRASTGDVIVVLDSHVEMYSSTWAQHLLLPILENPRTMAMQTLDVIDDRPGHARNKGGAAQHYGFVDQRFLFSYVPHRFGENVRGKETPPKREPFEIPFAPGSLFAIRRDEFWRLGGYDRGLLVWGGENTELVMKVWLCGGFDDPTKPAGRVVVVPCSRVGHVYRIHIKETGRWPPKIPQHIQQKYQINARGRWRVNGGRADLFTRLVERNNLRIFHVWLGNTSYTRNYFNRAYGVNSTDPGKFAPEWRKMMTDIANDTEIERQIALREKNKCKSIDWFDRHVVYRLVGRHLPFHDSSAIELSCGQHKAKSCGECPQGNGKEWCNGDCHWCEYGASGQSKNATATVLQGKSTKQIREMKSCLPKKQL